MISSVTTRFLGFLLAIAVIGGPALAAEVKNPLVEGETWAELKGDIVGDAEILDGSALFEVDAPYRAHDAATVPVRMVQAVGSTARIVRLTLVVDENPAPVVAEFAFGPSFGRLDLETRVRVDQYSNIRAIAETADGRLWMAGRYVKGAGGCSAPALKDMDAALASAGQLRLKTFDPAKPTDQTAAAQTHRREVQVMIRHPNYSGLQRNQVTQLFIPAYFIDEMSVFAGDERLFHMTGGISISEDPTFRFSYNDNGAAKIVVHASDTDGGRFGKTFAALKESSS